MLRRTSVISFLVATVLAYNSISRAPKECSCDPVRCVLRTTNMERRPERIVQRGLCPRLKASAASRVFGWTVPSATIQSFPVFRNSGHSSLHPQGSVNEGLRRHCHSPEIPRCVFRGLRKLGSKSPKPDVPALQ